MPRPATSAHRPPRLSPQESLNSINVSTERFATLTATADLDSPVPSCPDWTLTDLVAHLGEIHQWAAHAIVAANPDADTIPAPTGQAALTRWYRDAARGLSEMLRSTDPDTAAWTFGPEPRTASFWFRRQMHETALHLWDAAVSQGTAEPIAGPVALDGIDELTDMFFPRQVRLGRTPPLGRALALEATGADTGRWVLTGDGTGPAGAVDAPAEATVTGPAEALLLLLWGRIGMDDDRLAMSGDETAAHAVLSATLTP